VVGARGEGGIESDQNPDRAPDLNAHFGVFVTLLAFFHYQLIFIGINGLAWVSRKNPKKFVVT
jgi:hypothetical protein